LRAPPDPEATKPKSSATKSKQGRNKNQIFRTKNQAGRNENQMDFPFLESGLFNDLSHEIGGFRRPASDFAQPFNNWRRSNGSSARPPCSPEPIPDPATQDTLSAPF